jgi:ribosomal protein RSM22 (predicted rRNA methylase)
MPQIERSVKQRKGNIGHVSYSYCIIQSPHPTKKVEGLRLILPPLKRKGHVIFDYCSPSAYLARRIVSKAKTTPEAWREAKKARMGDLFYGFGEEREVKREEGWERINVQNGKDSLVNTIPQTRHANWGKETVNRGRHQRRDRDDDE